VEEEAMIVAFRRHPDQSSLDKWASGTDEPYHQGSHC